jgi:hypothetical protein
LVFVVTLQDRSQTMSILRPSSTLFYTNPLFQSGLDALSWWLEENHYSQHAREAVLAHTAAEGTPTGCAYLETEDEGPATEAFVGALPAVPYDSTEWGEDRPDDADRSIPADTVLVPPELLELAPLCGGGPEPPTPTDEDLADYGHDLELLEREQVRALLARADAADAPRYGYE